MDGESVTFSMTGEPRGKGRPRVFVQGGRSIATTDPLTRAYEASVTEIARKAMGGRPPFVGALSVSIRFRMPIPQSASKKAKAAMALGETPHTSSPDLDNLAKAVLDGMAEDADLKDQIKKQIRKGLIPEDQATAAKRKARVTFVNDSQIVRLWVEKVYSASPGIDVKVMCLEPQCP